MANPKYKCCNILCLTCIMVAELIIAAIAWTFYETFDGFGVYEENIYFLKIIQWCGFAFSIVSLLFLITSLSKCTLQSQFYTWCLCILIIAKLASAGIYLKFYIDKMFEQISNSLKDLFQDYKKTRNHTKQEFVHSCEKELHCCGLKGLEDWDNNDTELQYCREFPEDPNSHLFDKGCNKIIDNYIDYMEDIFKMGFFILFGILAVYLLIKVIWFGFCEKCQDKKCCRKSDGYKIAEMTDMNPNTSKEE